MAEAEADGAFLRLSQVTSPTQASQWYSGLLQAIESLSRSPKRCSLARENRYFSQEIRQLLYGRGVIAAIISTPVIAATQNGLDFWQDRISKLR